MQSNCRCLERGAAAVLPQADENRRFIGADSGNFTSEYVIVITMISLEKTPGTPLPAGATLVRGGVNFSVFSRHAASITLDIFETAEAEYPVYSFQLDPIINRTGDMWHICIQGLEAGAFYLYRADGPFQPEKGHRFNRNAYLLDPYAKALTNVSIFANLPPNYQPPSDRMDIELASPCTAKGMPKCVVICDDFDWNGDQPLNYPMHNCVIYETHLKGFTADDSSGVRHPGTYRGLIEKIPYLKELGVTSVELLPIQEFDENENTRVNPRTGERLRNYWGYSTVSFFAPKISFAAAQSPEEAVREFKEMVRELHRNGIEVILDIVFNHTAEGNENGVTINFRGFDNSIFYMLEDQQKRYYKNFSGCGNTVNCNHPVVHNFIIDCLRYWVMEMHVDGFRFDLASILGRDQKGNLIQDPPVLSRIAEDPILSRTKIIAEAWDAGGAYQVGSFPGGRWAEWNDRYRDDIRRFWRGDDHLANAAATRMAGSADLYSYAGRKPYHSVNFITSHDGFTLNDLVSYNGKHNEENGEQNRDGSDNNSSYNYGYEGPTQNRAIEAMRSRQIKNIILSLLLSQGTPMLLAGDEFRRTQKGNNNAYCQDNDISWIDWSLQSRYSDVFRFVKKAIAFRKRHPAFRRTEFFAGTDHSFNDVPDISWFDQTGRMPDWSKLNHFLAFRLDGSHTEIMSDMDDDDFFVMMNTSDKDTTVKLPPPRGGARWYRCIDTSIACPGDILDAGNEEALSAQQAYVLPAKTMAVLMGK